MRNTQLARNIIRSQPGRAKATCFTNLYENCRTVKCYSEGREAKRMVKALQAAGFQAKMISGYQGYSPSGFGPKPCGSVIARMPITY